MEKKYDKKIIEKVAESYMELFGGYEMLFDSIYKIKMIEKENNIRIIEPNKDPYESLMEILKTEYFKDAIKRKPDLAIKTLELIDELMDFFEKSSNIDIIKAKPDEIREIILKIRRIKNVFLELMEMTKGDQNDE